MVTLSAWLQKLWYRMSPWHALLLPLSGLFWLLSTVRRTLYRVGGLHRVRLPVTVIVVGNISVGGAGKTPLVIWLVNFLKTHGYHPGIVSRGYGGSGKGPQAVTSQSDPAEVGDEPLLLAQRCGCPVWIGRDRAAAGQALLAAHPAVDVLVSDDGLQHYRLRRDMEIAVIDGLRRFGNGFILPAGPLREAASRLRQIDAVVVNQPTAAVQAGQYAMYLRGEVFYNLMQPEQRISAADLTGQALHAVAGIGNPRRFFDHLRGLGLNIIEHAFADHHVYQARDLQFDGAILMTEKDAVKCKRWSLTNCWVLAVDAEIDAGLGQATLDKLRRNHGRKIT